MEHDLTHWYGTASDKIFAWRNLRKQAIASNVENAISLINSWWTYTPWVKKTIDPFRPSTWPTPWEMLHTGNFCRSAIALGQAYTVWAMFPDMKCEIWLINNKSEQDVHLITVINDNIALNYILGSVTMVEEMDYEHLETVKKSDLKHIKL